MSHSPEISFSSSKHLNSGGCHYRCDSQATYSIITPSRGVPSQAVGLSLPTPEFMLCNSEVQVLYLYQLLSVYISLNVRVRLPKKPPCAALPQPRAHDPSWSVFQYDQVIYI